MKHILDFLTLISLINIVCCAWDKCDVITTCQTTPCDKNPKNMTAECTLVTVPLNWNQNSTTITIFVKHIFAKESNNSQNDIWMLMGGPGFSGSALDSYAVSVISMNRTTHVYIPDHRGTGRSSYLSTPTDCGVPIGECVKNAYGDKLQYYSVTQAARDIIFLIDKFSSGSSKKSIYGWSYGTYLLNRVLQIRPDIGNLYAFEGLCPPGVCTWDVFDMNTNNVISAVLTLCTTNSALCQYYLGSNPIEIAALIYSQINAGSLPCMSKLNKTVTTDIFRSFFGNALGISDGRVVIGPLLKRLFVCSPSDITELNFLLNLLPSYLKQQRQQYFDFPPDEYFGFVLSSNIIVSELLSANPTPSLNITVLTNQVLQIEKSLIASFGTSYGIFSLLQSGPWPIYSVDSYYHGYANIQKPFLLLQGELDPQTSHAFLYVASQNYPKNNNKYVVSIPYAVHQTSNPGIDTNIPCGLTVLTSFFNTGVPDTSCIKNVPPPDFDGKTPESQSVSLYLFGTSYLWGN